MKVENPLTYLRTNYLGINRDGFTLINYMYFESREVGGAFGFYDPFTEISMLTQFWTHQSMSEFYNFLLQSRIYNLPRFPLQFMNSKRHMSNFFSYPVSFSLNVCAFESRHNLSWFCHILLNFIVFYQAVFHTIANERLFPVFRAHNDNLQVAHFRK